MIENIKGFVENHRLGHAYLVAGLSILEAKKLVDEIINLLSLSLHDLHQIKAENHSIKVDQIRGIVDRLSRSPFAKKHFVVIHQAEQMNIAASNALLKILEEPPGNTLFLLFATHESKLLPTIFSRVQVLRAPGALMNEGVGALAKEIYAYAPSLLDEEMLGVRLYEHIGNNEAFTLLQALSINDFQKTLGIFVTTVAYYTKKHLSFHNFQIYQQALNLYKNYQKFKNHNEKNLRDQMGLMLANLN